MTPCDNYEFKAIVDSSLSGLAIFLNCHFENGWQFIPNSITTHKDEVIAFVVKRPRSLGKSTREVLAGLTQEQIEIEKQDELRRSRP